MTIVYRSTDPSAREQAQAVADLLISEGLDAEVADHHAPGVPEGAVEVRVDDDQSARAEEIIANNPLGGMDLSHGMDLVVVFQQPAGAVEESEAYAVQGLLQANGIPAMVVSPSMLPNLSAQVRVPRDREEEAKQVIADAQAAGPAAAEEAEQAGEAGA
jgi:hypothetical protein